MDTLSIQPLSRPFITTIQVPGSKSYTQRALIIASLAQGTSLLQNVCLCDDTQHMMQALQSLDVRVELDGTTLTLFGTGGLFLSSKKKSMLPIILQAGNGGTTLRFLLALSSIIPRTIHFMCSNRLKQRPLGPLLETMRSLGVTVHDVSDASPYIKTVGGTLAGGACTLQPANSSQFVSALLMILPYAQHPTTLVLSEDPPSQSYIHMTLDCMNSFGIAVRQEKSRFFTIPQKAYTATDYIIEPDASSAGYFFAAAALCNSTVTIPLNRATKQGDIALIDVLENMGCIVTTNSSTITLKGGNLRGVSVDMNTMPDSVPIVAVLAASASGTTRITNIPHLHHKECDRISALQTELTKLGVSAIASDDSLTINGSPAGIRTQTVIETYNDHRIAMSFGILGLKYGLTIKNPECVTKSFPTFWDTVKNLYSS